VVTKLKKIDDYKWIDLRPISKLRNSHRSGKIDLSVISVWDGARLYYCQQIVACHRSKRFV